MRPLIAQLGIAGGLGLILIGGALVPFLGKIEYVGWITLAVGVGLVALTLRSMGRGVTRTRYRRDVWRDRDTMLAAFAVGVIAFLLVYRFAYPVALTYYPFPQIQPPNIDLAIMVALLGLLAPLAASNSLKIRSRKTAQYDRGQSLQPNSTNADPPARTGAVDPTTHTGHVRK